jgi:hypothetical protein
LKKIAGCYKDYFKQLEKPKEQLYSFNSYRWCWIQESLKRTLNYMYWLHPQNSQSYWGMLPWNKQRSRAMDWFQEHAGNLWLPMNSHPSFQISIHVNRKRPLEYWVSQVWCLRNAPHWPCEWLYDWRQLA